MSTSTSLEYQNNMRKSLVVAMFFLVCATLLATVRAGNVTATSGEASTFWDADIFHLPPDGKF